jgi:hypothetical protein
MKRKPARQVVTRSPKRTVGRINCPWFQSDPIEHESRLEKHFIYLCLLAPGVVRIEHQPFCLSLLKLGRRYTPDFLVHFQTGKAGVNEVKHSSRTAKHTEVLDAAAEQLGYAGMSFFLFDESHIERGGRAERAGSIRRYAMLPVSAELVGAATDLIIQHPQGLNIGELRERINLSLPQLCHLIARRSVLVNADCALSDQSLVYPNLQENHHGHTSFATWFGAAPWRAHV